MRNLASLGVVLLFFAVTNGPARADCAKKHIYLMLAHDAARHMNVYGADGDHDMARAAMSEGTHWYNMAETEPCGGQSLADDNLEISLQYVFDADTRRGVQIRQQAEAQQAYLRQQQHAANVAAAWAKKQAEAQQAYLRQPQHAANVAAAWAKKHPSKWALAHPASTLKAVEPDTPLLARQYGISGTVQVEVWLDEGGRVTNAVILSSPSPVLNEAALTAARNSTFRPEIKNGKPIAAKYLFTVDFQ